jgi:hypothetical protein
MTGVSDARRAAATGERGGRSVGRALARVAEPREEHDVVPRGGRAAADERLKPVT